MKPRRDARSLAVAPRLLLSWTAVISVLVLGMAVLAAVALLVDKQLHDRAVADVRQRATVTAELVTAGEFTPTELPDRISSGARARMSARIDRLRANDEALALQLWTPSGSLVFDYPADIADTSAEVEAVMRNRTPEVRTDQDHVRFRSDDVLVPLDLTADGQPDVVAVVLQPVSRLDGLREQARVRLGVGGAILGCVLVTMLLLARRRELRRDHQMRHDPLTGLGNRVELTQVSQQRPGTPYSLLLLDLDGFKEVNDTLGHAAGDELLMQVARALTSVVRKPDLVVRLGGDEFVVLLADVATPEVAMGVAEEVKRGLARSGFTVRGVALDVQASTGVAVNASGDRDLAALLREADVAMYRAKANGGGASVYDPSEDPHDVDRLALLGQLRHAIDHDELTLVYQPLVRLSSGPGSAACDDAGRPAATTIGVEALVRWQHPERGLLSPVTFVPFAEHTGLIYPLTSWVLNRAVAQLASWLRAGLDLTVAVNLSPRAITETLLGDVLTVLDRHQVPAGHLKLEITETALANDPARTVAVLRTLRAAGVQISLDDFGAGYTSLAYLTALPLTELKIDKSFVDSVTVSSDKSAVVSAVVDLGHRLGLFVVAEGVETTETGRQVADLGCDVIQGYLYSRPLRPDQLEGWITDFHSPIPAVTVPRAPELSA